MNGFGATFYGLDSLPDTSQQKYTMDLFYIRFMTEKDRFCLCVSPSAPNAGDLL